MTNFNLPQYVNDGTTGVLPEENGYGSCPPPSVKDPPLYIQPRMDEPSYDKPIQVHPSIADFPSHVRKVSSSLLKIRQWCLTIISKLGICQEVVFICNFKWFFYCFDVYLSYDTEISK